VGQHHPTTAASGPVLEPDGWVNDPTAPAPPGVERDVAPDDPWLLDAAAWLAAPDADAVEGGRARGLGRRSVEARAEHIHAASRAAAVRISRR
jgi:hypothetical protein